MLFVIQLALALAPAALAAAPAESPALARNEVIRPFPSTGEARDCPNPQTQFAVDRSGDLRARRLDELPQGRLEYAVHREVDGCAIPAVVREGIGGSAAPEEGDRR
jgi:hypothetical protein